MEMRGFGAHDVYYGVGSYWVENINWMRVASDLKLKQQGRFVCKVTSLARKPKVN